jgi:hypothetical protein
MDLRRKILWIDSCGGLVAGAAVLLLSGWLSERYVLPQDLLRLIGGANVGYGLYSLFLASRPRRSGVLILLLVIANLVWAAACLRWAVAYNESASLFGLAHLGGEGVYVGALACLEWRWRELLRHRESR